MTDEQLALARRAVACRKWWAWMPGMLDAVLGRVIAVHEDEIVFHDCRVDLLAKVQPDSPDLDDPATRGCLLELVRQAWGGHDVWFEPDMANRATGEVFVWQLRCRRPNDIEERMSLGATQESALVEALEAAP